jgi:anti-sigma B factor antagonist
LIVEERKQGDILILGPREDLMGMEDIRVFEEKVRQGLADHFEKFIIDCGQMNHINSSGLGSLAAAHISVRKDGGRLIFANVPKRINNLFLITKLAFTVEIVDTLEEALRRMEEAGTGA